MQRPLRPGDLAKINLSPQQSDVQNEYLVLNIFIVPTEINIIVSPQNDKYSTNKLTIVIDGSGVDKIKGMAEIPKIDYLRGGEPGNVYVAAMNLRGKRAPKPEGATSVNATSCQRKDNKDRRDFSPMTEIDGRYKNYWNFESYWQSGKVFEGIPHNISQTWWKQVKIPKRRYPKGKGKQVLYARFDHINEDLPYVESRKRVYVPEYYNMIKDREQTQYWRRKVLEGNDIVVYDMDGPRTEDGEPITLPVTLDMLKDKIEYTRFPFGHGYVVAATFAGITPDQYI